MKQDSRATLIVQMDALMRRLGKVLSHQSWETDFAGKLISGISRPHSNRAKHERAGYLN